MKTKTLPHNWQIKRFIDCVEPAKAIKIKGISKEDYQANGKYPIIDQGENLICGFTDDLSLIYREELPVIIFGDHTKIFKYIDFPFAVGADGTKTIKPNKKVISPRFLYYSLLNSKIINLGYSRHYKLLRQLSIPLPPLPVQQAIVGRLDAIRNTQEFTDKQITLTEELFQSLLAQELNPKGKNWEVKKLINVCEINPRTKIDKSSKTIKYIEMAALDEKSKKISYLLDKPLEQLSSGSPKFTNRDVIFARITPCTEHGKVALIENNGGIYAGSTEFHVVRANKERLLPRFLFYFLIKPEVRDMAVRSMTGATGRQRVPPEFLHYLRIALPPLPIQRAIVEKLQSVQNYKSKLMEQKTKLAELFTSALSRAMSGELVS